MLTKKCFKCHKIKSLEDFYKHNQTADGHLNKCKDCTKKDVKKRYYNPEARKKIIKYEKAREKTEKRKRLKSIYQKKRRLKSPGKVRARSKLNNAIRDGRIMKKPCQICGSQNSQGHHKDYRKFLDVDWLCRKCHLTEEGKIPF